TTHGIWVVRADVAGRADGWACAGSSGIVRPDGTVAATATAFAEDLLVVDVGPRLVSPLR
ncbi:MAG: hypothetical protein ABI024_10110, partial [Vicinamibacterales bacterium]